MTEREMTLQEWVERLPEIHTARREYNALRSRLAEVERLLQEVYDGRQSLMSVGLVYRIGHTLNHRPADSATPLETTHDE